MGQAQTLEGHTDFVEDLAVSPDGRRAVSASGDQTLRVWELEAGRTVATFTAESPVMELCAGIRRHHRARRDLKGLVHVLRYAPGR